jgi:DUF438 domain-containing protein
MFLILALIATSQAAPSDWQQVASQDRDTMFVDTTSIRGERDRRSVTVKIATSDSATEKHLDLVIDCTAKTFEAVAGREVEKGVVVRSMPTPTEAGKPEPIRTTDPGEAAVLRLACGG